MTMRLSNRCRHLCIAVLVGTAASAATGAPRAAQTRVAFAQVAIPHDRFTLPNGLTVIVHSDRSVPSVFIGLWYGVGAKDEPAGQTGFAHLFEHLMFQETAARRGDFLQAMTAAGGSDVNGMTTGDVTTFHEIVPTGSLDLALWMEADRMAHLGGAITQRLLDQQRSVVKNEKRQQELQPGAYSRARLLASFYPAGHPYAHDPIGSMADIDRATLAQAKAWFARYYGARNATLVLAGDIDLATAREKVSRYFGNVPAGQPSAAPAPWLPASRVDRHDHVRDAVPNATLMRTWAIPSGEARDLTLLRLAAVTLTAGLDSPLQKALVAGNGPALAVAATLDEQKLVSTFSISMGLRPGASPERAGALLDAAMARYLRRGPDPRRLASIILGGEVELLRSLDSAAAIGNRLGSDQALHGDPVFVLRQREWYAGASPQALRAVAGRWLGRPHHDFVTLPGDPPDQAEPSGDAPPTGIEAGPPSQPASTAGSVPMPAANPLAGRVTFPPVTRMRLTNGLTLVVAERHRLPFVRFAMRFPTGTLSDPPGAPGVTRAAIAMMSAATTGRDESGMEQAIGDTGIDLSTDTDSAGSTVTWTTLSAMLDPSFALVADILRRPTYPQDRIDRDAADRSARFDAYEGVPQNAAEALLRNALWGGSHPLGRIETRDHPDTLSRRALLDAHARAIVPADATLYVIGDITPSRARALVERHLGDWRGPSTAPVRAEATGATAARIILVDAPGAEQSTIMAGAIVRPADPVRASAEQLADEALSSRLNTALRDERGWSYGVGGGIADTPKGPRVFSVGGSVETGRTAESVALIRRIIGDVTGSRPITQNELDGYRAAAIREIPTSLSNGDALLRAIIAADAVCMPATYAETAGQRLSAVTLPDLRQVARDIYRADGLTWVIVGDLRRIERDVRALGLAPVEVRDVYGRALR